MSILSLIVVLILIGVVLYLVNAYLPMDPKIKGILNVVVVILVILWLIQGIFGPGSLGTIRIGR